MHYFFLLQHQGEVEVKDPETADRVKTFKIKVQRVNIIDMSEIKNLRPGASIDNLVAVQALDVILRSAPSSRALTVSLLVFMKN